MIAFILKAILAHSVLYCIYWLFLRKESDYDMRRTYLIGMTIISMTIPFVQIPVPEVAISFAQNNLPAYYLDELVVGEQAQVSSNKEISSINWSIIATIGYSAIACILIGTILQSLIQLLSLFKKSKSTVANGVTVRQHPSIKESFSFFNWVFVQDVHPAILRHELAHVRLWHSADILLFQFTRAMLWMSPITWSALKEIKLVHEFQADAAATKEENIDEYRKILISASMASLGWNLASSFHEGALTKRLNAMKKTQKQISKWKISILGMLVATVVVTFSCSEEMDQQLTELAQNANMAVNYSDEVVDKLVELRNEYPDNTFTVIELNEIDKAKIKSELANFNISAVKHLSIDEKNEKATIIVQAGGEMDQFVHKSLLSIDGNEQVYTVVDQIPEFEGGMTEFYKYVGSTITYPKQARQAGTSGRVFVQFVVEKDGSVSNVQTVKGVSPELDTEAEKVIATSPNFQPGSVDGKPVRVRMVIPIVFALSDDNNQLSGDVPPPPPMKVEVIDEKPQIQQVKLKEIHEEKSEELSQIVVVGKAVDKKQ
ncbi:MAG: TonB family protein [Cyclobacteriaceae bacterium]